MKIGICNDHAGVEYKERLVEYLTGKGYEMVNFGTDTTASMDYPDVAHPLATAVETGEVDLGIAFCGTGNGKEQVHPATDALVLSKGHARKRIEKSA